MWLNREAANSGHAPGLAVAAGNRLALWLLCALALTLPVNLSAAQIALGLTVMAALASPGFRRAVFTGPLAAWEYAGGAYLATIGASWMINPPVGGWYASTAWWTLLVMPVLGRLPLGRSGRRPALMCFFASATAMAALGAIQAVTGERWPQPHKGPLVPHGLGPGFAAVGNFEHASSLGFVLMMALIWAVAARANLRGRGGAMAIIGVGLAATGVRSAWLGALAGGTMLLWRHSRGAGPMARRRALAAAILLAALVGTAAAWAGVGPGPRAFIWERAAAMWADHPWLGIGYGNYTPFTRYYYDIMDAGFAVRCHAHNNYLHVATETGVCGFFALLAAIGLWLREQWRLRRFTALALTAAAAVYAVFQDPLADGESALTLGVLLAVGREEAGSRSV